MVNDRPVLRRIATVLLAAGFVAAAVSPAVGGEATWTSTDVGAVGVSGSATESNGVWTIQGAGSDIWGSADAFQYVYRQTSLPMIELTVRVDDLQDTNPFAKSGLMLRSSLDPSAATAILDVKPNGEVEFMLREIDGGQMFYWGGASLSLPVWLKIRFIQPRDPTIEAFVSQDGANWTAINFGGNTFGLPGSYDVGVAVTSHNDQQLTTSHVDGLSLVPLGWTNSDIGATGVTGNTVVDDAQSFTVQGAGADIWGSDDAFQYVYQPLQANTSGLHRIAVRVASGPQTTNQFAKAGVMIRDSLRPDAAQVIVDVKPDGGVEFMARSSTGDTTMFIAGGTLSPFGYLILDMNGPSFTGRACEADGTNCQTLGTITASISPTGFIGLAVTSHDPSVLTTAVFGTPTVD